MSKGWITLHRKLQDTPLWLNDPFSRGQAWVDLLLLANHAKGYIRINGERSDIERGQLGRSILTLSKRWKWSRGKTTRFLKELEKDKQITLKTNIKNSTITICNYDTFQPTKTTSSTTNSTTDGHQTVQQADTNNKKQIRNNKDNKDNKLSIVEGSREPPPPIEDMIKLWNDKIQTVLKPKTNGITLTKARRPKFAKRFKDEFHSSFAEWSAYLEAITNTEFLMGVNDRGWAVDIDWALKPVNIIKVSEGKYGAVVQRELTREERIAEVKRNIDEGACKLLN